MMRWPSWALVASALLLAAGVAQSDDYGPEKEAVNKPRLVLDAGGHLARLSGVLFTPDGKQVVTASIDKTVRTWDVGTGEPQRTFRLPAGTEDEGRPRALAISPDGRALAVAGDGLEVAGKLIFPVYLIDLAAGKMLDRGALRGHEETIWSLAFSPDGKRLVSGTDKGNVRVWNVEKRACEHVLDDHKNRVTSLVFSPDGRQFASGCGSGGVHIWNAAKGKALRIIATRNSKVPESSGVSCLAWSPDGKTLATPGYTEAGATIRLWNTDGSYRKSIALGRPSYLQALTFTADSRAILVGGWSQEASLAEIHDVETGEVRTALTRLSTNGKLPVPVDAAALSPDGKLAAIAAGPGESVFLFNTQDGTLAHRLHCRAPTAFRLGWSSDSQSVTWRAGNGQRRSFHLGELRLSKPDREPTRFEVHKQGDLALELGPKSPKVSTAILLKEGEKLRATLPMPRGNPVGASYTFVGKDRVAVAGYVHYVCLFDLDGKLVLQLRGVTGWLRIISPSPDGKWLVGFGGDHMLHIWRLDRADPVVSLFVSDIEWIAWAPEGYYAASAGGERLMGWQINNGPDALATFYPAAQFRRSLYRPDVIGRLLKEGSVEKALEAADRARGGQRSVAVAVSEMLPPRVTLRAPGLEGTTTSRPTLDVEAVAVGAGKYPITSVVLLLDGRPVEGGKGLYKVEDARPGAEVKHRWTVALPPGEHTLRALARSEASTGLSDDLDVTYTEAVPKPRLCVLAIGINEYQARGLALACAVNDARELHKTFEDHSGGLFDVRARVLTDTEATRDGALAGLKWLRGQLRPQDLAVVFFAGHGEVTSKGRFLLLPCDVKVSQLEQTSISGEELKEHLAGLPGKVLLLLDACHSGAIGKVISDLARDLADEDCGVVVLCAALGSEKAGESKDKGHGYFCLALIEALSGKAPKSPRDGCVYLHHLEQYVIDRVQELSKDEQHPTSAKPALRPFALARP